MAARPRITFDKTEIVLGFLAGNKFQVLNLNYSDIQRIQFDQIVERRFLKRVPSEQISVVTAKRMEPIVYTKLKSEKFWDTYKTGFAKFANNNHITFADNTTT